jgi:general secretion pathway protein D
MKTILPLLLALLLASCSNRPPRGFEPYGPDAARPQDQTAEAGTRKAPPASLPGKATAEKATPATTNVATTNVPSTNLVATNFFAGGRVVTNIPPSEPGRPDTLPGALAFPAPIMAAAADTNAAPAAPRVPEEIIPAGTINFPATDLNQVLQIYSELVNRTVLRPANLGAPMITLKTQTPLTKKEAIQAFDAVLAMNGITMINVGEKFVKAVPTAGANQEGAPFNRLEAGQLPEIGQYVTHVVQLKYVRPTELVPVLQPFAKIPNSILPIDSSQILVLRDFTENVKRMLEMITKVDVVVPSEYISEVIPIKYAKASEIADALNSLGGGGGTSVGRSSTGGSRPAAGAAYNRPTGGMGGMGGMGTMGGTTPFGGQATPGAAPGQAGGAATSFTDRLKNIIKSASTSGDLQILGQTKMIADERSNSLLIFATRADMEMIKNIVAKLDVVLAQVLIETIIMDVSVNDSLAFGLSAIQTPKDFNNNVAGAGAVNAKQFFNFSQNQTGDTNAFSDLIGTGLRYFTKVDQNYYLQVQAAASAGKVNVIQKPRILTSHATPGSIFIGNTVPYITSTYYGGGYGGPSSSYQQLQVGIGLTVTPYINPEGLVVMQIDESIDEISGSTPITGVGDVPTTTSRKLSAEVAVPDGDSVLLGGFIRNASTKQKSGVPILQDLPLLGWLFTSKGDSKQRNELMVLMRPTVLRTPNIAALTTQDEKHRLPGIMSAEAEFEADEKKHVEKEQKRILDRQAAEARADKANSKAPSSPGTAP